MGNGVCDLGRLFSIHKTHVGLTDRLTEVAGAGKLLCPFLTGGVGCYLATSTHRCTGIGTARKEKLLRGSEINLSDSLH